MIRILKKVNQFLCKKEKVKSFWILVIMIISAMLDMVSVSLFVPLINAILNEDYYLRNNMAGRICSFLGISSSQEFTSVVFISIIILFIGKAVITLVQTYIGTSFTIQIKIDRRKKVMQSMMELPYQYFTSQNSEKVRRTLTEDLDACFDVVNNILTFMTQLLSILAVGIVVFLVDWKMALITCVILGGELVILAKIIKPIVYKLGEQFRETTAEVNIWLMQSVAGIKEIMAADNQKFFVEKSNSALLKQSRATLKNTVVQKVPIVILESATICSVIMILLIFVLNGGELTQIAPQLTAFAVAVVKLIPAAKQINSANSILVYREPSLDAIMETEKLIGESKRRDVINSKKMLTCEKEFGFSDVSFKYQDSDEWVLDSTSVTFKVGQAVGIKGVSGGGKTTSIDILLGLLKPQKGYVFTDSGSIEDNLHEWRKLISYIPQNIYLIDDTIKANICFGLDLEQVDDARINDVLKEAALEELVKSLPNGINTKIGERGTKLSGGQRQRIGIARALYRESEILIFDEATSALDNQTEKEVMQSINNLRGKKTLLIIAHRLSTLDQCDEIYEIKNGKFEKVV